MSVPRLAASQVVYVGARDVDPPEQRYIDEFGIQVVAVQPLDTVAARLEAALQRAEYTAAYVHVDLDVLEPAAFPHTCCPTPEGLSLRALLAALGAVGRALPVVGCGLTECCGNPASHAAELDAVVDALAALLEQRN